MFFHKAKEWWLWMQGLYYSDNPSSSGILLPMKKALYAFSGDPITFGHVNIVQRAAQIFDQVVVAIGVNPDKTYTFSLEDRTEMAQRSLDFLPNVTVTSFTGMLTDFAYEQGIPVIIKGVRNASDFEYERHLDQLGDSQKLGIDTVLLFADPQLAHVSSSAVKAIQKEQGLVHEYVPLYVKQKLEEVISGQYIWSVTGEIGVGKTYVCQRLVELGKKQGLEVHNIELDHIAHDIYEKLSQPRYKEVRETLIQTFGEKIKNANNTVNRKILGEIVFNDQEKLQQLNEIMYTPILVRLRREIHGKKGLILLNAALIAESNMAYLSNNKVLLVSASKSLQKERLLGRKLTERQIKTRLESQHNFEQKKKLLETTIAKKNQGTLMIIESNGAVEKQVTSFLKDF